MIKIKDLRKFNHYTEFEREKHLDSKYMILKQETMRIDSKLMSIDQSMFEILALQINEDDSLCQPECVPLIYNVSLGSIHGNVYINQSNNDANVANQHYGLTVNETKNELKMNNINFGGSLQAANHALKNLMFEPLCPLDSDNII